MEKKIYLIIYLLISTVIFISTVRYCSINNIPLNSTTISMESTMESAFPGKEVIKEFYGAVNRVVSPYEIAEGSGANVKDTDGFLQPVGIVSYDITEAANKISELKKICSEEGIPFAYISYPSKNSSYDVTQLYGIDSNAEEIRTNFLELLKQNDINILNIETIFEENEYTSKEIFYKTDHHWTTSAGLFTAREISKYLKEDFGLYSKPEMLNEDLFSYTNYENCWFGETGRKYSQTWVGALDDFTVIKPTYEASLEYIIPDSNIDIVGDFSILINDSLYNTEYDLYNTSLHYTYMPGAGLVTKIHNNNNLDGPRVLIIKDSFSVVVVPFLSLACKEIAWWDMRGNENSLYEYIQNNNFDIVLLAYTDFWRSDMYNFN